MKKCYVGGLAALLLLLGATAWAQYPPAPATVGVYFDAQGTQSTLSEFPPLVPVDAYIIVFWEALVGGTAYSVALDPRISVVTEEFPHGIAVGSAFDGCGVEMGLYSPGGIGIGGQPVLISHLVLMNVSPEGFDTTLCVMAHCSYEQVVVADTGGSLFSADGLCGMVIPTEGTSWGAVKELYR